MCAPCHVVLYNIRIIISMTVRVSDTKLLCQTPELFWSNRNLYKRRRSAFGNIEIAVSFGKTFRPVWPSGPAHGKAFVYCSLIFGVRQLPRLAKWSYIAAGSRDLCHLPVYTNLLHKSTMYCTVHSLMIFCNRLNLYSESHTFYNFKKNLGVIVVSEK